MVIVGVEVFGAGGPGGEQEPIRVFSIHAPRRGSYAKAVHAILDMIAKQGGQAKLVIGGDFNLSVGVRHVSEHLKTSVADQAIQRRLDEEFGLVHCWGAANPDRPLAQTLRWSSDPTVSYHCDGLFVPRSWSPS